jgi:hypothetical protein
MTKVLIIGAGGIGSWITSRIDRLNKHNQFHEYEFFIKDFDVVEHKNLLYQNFDELDVSDYKAEMLSLKYNVVGIPEKVQTFDDLKNFDVIISCVDNPGTRKLVFDYCDENKDVYFIDLRSKGATVYGVNSDAKWSNEKLTKSLGKDLTLEGSSCQRDYELSAGIIQTGNIIIAEIGAQWLLNYSRGQKNIGHFLQDFS